MLQLGRKTLDIVASSIIYTYDVDKTHNSIQKIPCLHKPASHYSLNRHDPMNNTVEQKLATTKSIRIFGGSFFAHPLPNILTKPNIK